MKILDIAEYVWAKSQKVEFGGENSWDPDLFTKNWINTKSYAKSWKKSSAGWYWFQVDMSYEKLHDLHKPQTLPDKGCNIGVQVHDNLEVFTKSLLCPHNSDGVVIYNGHEAGVTKRIRSHFTLKNSSTGAIGLKHYPLTRFRSFYCGTLG